MTEGERGDRWRIGEWSEDRHGVRVGRRETDRQRERDME